MASPSRDRLITGSQKVELELSNFSETPKKSPLGCILLLGATGLGTGLLLLPQAMAAIGLLGFFVVLAVGAFVCSTTTYVLFVAVARSGASPTYSELLVSATFPLMATVLNCIVIIYSFGSMVCYLLFLSRYVQQLPFWPSGLGQAATVILFGLIDFPLTVPLKVTTLTKFSSMTLVSLSFMVLCILFEAPGKIASRPAEATVEAFADLDKTPAVACLSVFALMWHTNCVGVARELDNPTAKRCAVVSVGGTAFVTFLYALIAVGGYLSFGSGVRSDIVSMYTDDPFFLVVRCFITCSLLVTIPVNMFPLRESVFVMLKSMSPSLEMTFPVRILMSAVILGGAVVMAIVYPDITRIMQLLGGSLATLLMIVFPAIIGRLVLPFSTWVVSMVSAGLFAAFLIPAAVGLIGKPL